MAPLLDLSSSPRSMFASMDTDGNGSLSVHEVKMALSGFGQSLVQQAMDQMVPKNDACAFEFDEIKFEQFERGMLPILQSFHKANEERKLRLRKCRTKVNRIQETEASPAASAPIAAICFFF